VDSSTKKLVKSVLISASIKPSTTHKAYYGAGGSNPGAATTEFDSGRYTNVQTSDDQYAHDYTWDYGDIWINHRFTFDMSGAIMVGYTWTWEGHRSAAYSFTVNTGYTWYYDSSGWNQYLEFSSTDTTLTRTRSGRSAMSTDIVNNWLQFGARVYTNWIWNLWAVTSEAHIWTDYVVLSAQAHLANQDYVWFNSSDSHLAVNYEDSATFERSDYYIAVASDGHLYLHKY
jgi:hypothetical protein